MGNLKTFPVEVIYAMPEEQILLQLQAKEGDTIQDVINASGILEKCPDIDLSSNQVGRFGKRQSLETTVAPNDRIEIYRPLTIDPKQARVLRVKKKP